MDTEWVVIVVTDTGRWVTHWTSTKKREALAVAKGVRLTMGKRARGRVKVMAA